MFSISGKLLKLGLRKKPLRLRNCFPPPITIPKKKGRGFAKKKNRVKPKEKPGWTAGQTKLMMEHLAGIEPVYPAWEAGVLPLNYRCIGL